MTCSLCNGTGFVQRGVVISREWVDDYVDWVADLVACSHPEASPESPAKDDTHRTAVVGARVRPENRLTVDRGVSAHDGEPAPNGGAG